MKILLGVILLSLVCMLHAVGKFSCPEKLQCYCFASDFDNQYRIHCSTNVSRNSGFDLTIQPQDLVRVQCKNSPDWGDLLLGSEISVGKIERFVFASCAPPGAAFSERVQKQLNVTGVEYLKYENLRGRLEAVDLEAFPELKFLVLTNNKLDFVSPDLLKGLPYLKQLELRNTNIRLPIGFFDKAEILKSLELSGNNIKFLRPGTFDGLKKIELLNLWQNNLNELESQVFRNLGTLGTLDIHMNNLRFLPTDIFEDLKNLEIINLSSNNFTTLPGGLFRQNPKLKILKFLYNKSNLTALPSGFLSNLTELRIVSFMRSGLHSVPENLLWGSTKLIELNLNRNFLTVLPAQLLKDAEELHAFTVTYNDLRVVPDDFFSNSRKLTKLDLSMNNLQFIKERTLVGLESLQELIIENNELSFIHVDAFSSLEELKIVRLANNKLTLQTSMFDLFGQVSPFHPCRSLEELSLAHNNISEIFSDWVISSTHLRKLDLSFNSFDYLQSEDLQFMSNSINVDLRFNSISHVNLERLEYISSNQSSSLGSPHNVSVYLNGNPLECGCSVYSLLRYLNGEMKSSAVRFAKLDLHDVNCAGPNYMLGEKLVELKASQLKCLVESESSQEGDPCSANSICDCWMRPSDHALLLDCAGRNLSRQPDWIDVRGVDSVEIDLAANDLEQAPSMTAPGYEKVTCLNLCGNRIRSINESLISANLETLNLDGNNLTVLDARVLRKISNSSVIKKLTLHDNPWECDCGSQELLSFVQSNYLKIPDMLNITCVSSNASLSQLSPLDLCPSQQIFIIIFCSLIVFLGLLFGSLAALFFRYQRQIKAWLYSKNICLRFVTEEEIDCDKTYDAFISYSHKDEEFVIKELVLKLEEGPRPYRICIHTRDWLLGEWIPTQIMRSVDESRRTIVVLSPNFIESVWGRLEFQTAHKQTLNEMRNRVVVVVYGDIGPVDNLDTELKNYLRMNTYIKWGDPWFWQKLRYALPLHSDNSFKSERRQRDCLVSRDVAERTMEELKITHEHEKEKIRSNFDNTDLQIRANLNHE